MNAPKVAPLYWIPLTLFLTLHIIYVAPETSAVRQGELIGPDSYNRMTRVLQLHDAGAWFDGTIARSNAPHGESQHYTRLFDGLLFAGGWVFSLGGDFRDGLFRFGVVISPLFQLGALFALFWALRPVFDRRLLLLIGVLFLAQPALTGHFYAGRADHHSLFVVLFILSFGGVLRLLIRPFDPPTAAATGLIAALFLWASVESMLPLFVNALTLTLFWIFTARDLDRKFAVFAGSLFFGVSVMLITERSWAGIGTIEYDRISMAHWLVAALIFGFGILIVIARRQSVLTASWRFRAGLAALWGSLSGLVVWTVFPGFFRGPFADIDERIRIVWLDHVQDAQPLLFGAYHPVGHAVSMLGFGLIALPFLLWLIRQAKEGGLRDLSIYVLISVAIFFPLTLMQSRLAGYTAILLIIPYAVCLARILDWIAARSRGPLIVIWRPLLVVLFAVGFTAFGAILDKTERAAVARAAAPVCRVPDIATFLNSYPPGLVRPLTLLASADLGPELLYRTPHRVIATPYRGNAPGILDVYGFFAAATDDDARRIADERKVDLVVLCPGTLEPQRYRQLNGADGLYHRLLDGDVPPWLRAVPLPDNLAQSTMIFAVIR